MGWTSANPQTVMNVITPRALREIAINVTKTAVLIVPVGESRPGYVGGRLKGSIAYEVFDDRAEIGTNVEYAAYVEYGTTHMAAQSYLRRALDEERGDAIKSFKDEITKEYRKYGK